MLESKLREYLKRIEPLDQECMDKARKHQARLAKPPGSLGRLEDFSIQIAGITKKLHNVIEKKAVFVFAADNGVVEEGVSSAPQSVTWQQSKNMVLRKTGASTIAADLGCAMFICDVGINTSAKFPGIIDQKIAFGTRNIAKEPAMTRLQASRAVCIGIEQVMENAKDMDVIGVGEMGIGNTTTSSAVLAALTGASVESVTGRGGGITDASFAHKKKVICHAIQQHNPNPDDVLDVLSKVGGFDLAAMCGAFLGSAILRKPVVIDGFISAVAALCAVRLCAWVREYLIPSHASHEIGYKLAMNELGLEPMLLLNMRLGEGSGCPLAFEVLRASCAAFNCMATFESAGINDDYLDEIREIDAFSVGDGK